MVDFVALLQPAQDGDGVLDARLIDLHRLEAAFQRGVLFDVLPILIQRGRANGAEFAARELRLEHVAGVDRALARPRTDDGVQLVDEEDDLALRVGDFLEERLESVLEFAAELRARDHRADVHRDDLLVFQRLRHIPADDPPRQPLDDRRLAHARLADEHRVVFRAPRKHLHDAADFIIAPDDGIDFPLLRQRREIAPVFLQRLIFPLGILVRDALRTAHLLQRGHQLGARDPRVFQNAGGGDFRVRERQEVVLGAEVFVLQLGHFLFGGVERGGQFAPQPDLPAVDRGPPRQLRAQLFLHAARGHAELVEKRSGESFALLQQREEKMFVVDFGVPGLRGQILRGLHGLLHLLSEAVESHSRKVCRASQQIAFPNLSRSARPWRASA